MSGVDLFDDRAWDDRALVRGWNTQVKEYSKYHGLKRKNMGAKLDERLSAEEITELKESSLADPDELEEMGVDLDDAESDDALRNEVLQDISMEDDSAVYPSHPNESADTSLNDAVDAQGGAEEADAAERQLMQEQQQGHQHRPPATAPQAPPFPGPASAAAPGQDDALKNMIMSWYFAGYYQGIYEGQARTSHSAT